MHCCYGTERRLYMACIINIYYRGHITSSGKTFMKWWIRIVVRFNKKTQIFWRDGVGCGAVGWGLSLQAGRSRVRFWMASLNFFNCLIFPAALRPGKRLRIKCKWVTRDKDGRCVGLTKLSPSCAECLEVLKASTSWNLSEPVKGL
jgi:hypothetical protein